MPDIQFCLLPDLCRPLLDKFYRSHRSPMRSGPQAQSWVARQPEIVGALCLTPIAHGHWLTGLFVAPPLRGQAVAGRLIEQALDGVHDPVWLFCHPDLAGFYQRLGFVPGPVLPAALTEKLTRYSRTKPLIAMGREPV